MSQRYAESLDDADAAQALHRILKEEERANHVLDGLAERIIKKPSQITTSAPEPPLPDSGEITTRATEQPKTASARIERYRER
jgi:hypothetical protein